LCICAFDLWRSNCPNPQFWCDLCHDLCCDLSHNLSAIWATVNAPNVEEPKILSWYLCSNILKTYNKISLLSYQGRLKTFWVALWCLLNICPQKNLHFKSFMVFTSQTFKMFSRMVCIQYWLNNTDFFHDSAGRPLSHHLDYSVVFWVKTLHWHLKCLVNVFLSNLVPAISTSGGLIRHKKTLTKCFKCQCNFLTQKTTE